MNLSPEQTEPDPPQKQSRVEEFDRYRGLLFSIAYRMLSSVADAEDMVQETFIRWHQAGDEDVHSPRAFLVTIVSRLCLNHLQSARVRREQYVGEWLPEPLLTTQQDIVRADDSLSMAFLLLLERLTPVERAVFLLREIFDYEYSEIAATLRLTEPNCRQVFHRARQHVADMRPRFSASPDQRDELLGRFIKAASSGDLDGLVSLLSEDVVFHSDGGGKAPALPNLIHGPDRVARALIGGFKKLAPPNLVSRLTPVNGAPGFVAYLNGKPFSVLTLDSSDGHIRRIFIVSNPEKLSHIPNLPQAPC